MESGSDYPNSNMFLLEVWRTNEIMNLKCVDRHDYIRSMTGKMAQKFDEYWGECNLLMSIVVVLDPRYKMKLINFCFLLIYPEFESSQHIENVLAVLHELFEVYVTAHDSSVLKQSASEQVAIVSNSVSTPHVSRVSTGRSRYQDHVRTTDVIRSLKSNLDICLEEDVYIGENDDNGEDIDIEFEALARWKFNALKYRILSKMANDILTVPITTVAFESSFSAGGKVIEPHRASLSTETVQMLLCGSDWVRGIHGLKKKSQKL
jgi:hypothetical protein